MIMNQKQKSRDSYMPFGPLKQVIVSLSSLGDLAHQAHARDTLWSHCSYDYIVNQSLHNSFARRRICKLCSEPVVGLINALQSNGGQRNNNNNRRNNSNNKGKSQWKPKPYQARDDQGEPMEIDRLEPKEEKCWK